MKCSVCGSTDSKVIDSRSTKNDLSIRRRRECLSCSSRFTTYESDIESLLQVILKRNSRPVTTLNNIRAVLYFILKTLDVLSKEMNKLVQKAGILEMNEKLHYKSGKMFKTARKQDALPTDKVIKIVGRYKKGINIPELKNVTGFDDKKIRNILYRATINGKIKKVDRGVYTMK